MAVQFVSNSDRLTQGCACELKDMKCQFVVLGWLQSIILLHCNLKSWKVRKEPTRKWFREQPRDACSLSHKMCTSTHLLQRFRPWGPWVTGQHFYKGMIPNAIHTNY